MNPHVRLPLLGLFGLALLAPLSVSRAELSLMVETPVHSVALSGDPRHHFGGPAGSSIYMNFVFEEAYREYGTTYLFSHEEYAAVFDVTRSFAKGGGASLGWNEDGRGYVSGERSWGSNTWDYEVSFNLTIRDRSAANIVGHSRFLDYGGSADPLDPLYDTYAIQTDPYFGGLFAEVRIKYSSAAKPADFMRSLLRMGPMNESLMGSFYVDITSSRYATPLNPNMGSLMWYYASYQQGYNMDGNDFSAIIAVPEPSTYGIAAVGLLALAALARGRRGRRRAAA